VIFLLYLINVINCEIWLYLVYDLISYLTDLTFANFLLNILDVHNLLLLI